ncbi:LCP family protein [Cloacibacillus sp.]|uniref:LCP family protein n=1 Tax=Cloacibacillus sp. TaxID=2049023 RepID=UPI0025C064C0|nr:LCP family protein [Cloacibacillus sp.]MCC8058604.1 LCP family protein [Cloacibacillus sp.]
MRRSRTIILIIICGLVAIFGGAGLRFYFAWHTSQADILKAFENESQKKENDSYAALLKEQGRFNILVMGEDNVEGSRRSDTILFVTIDIDDKNMRVISLPRDTRVQIPHHGTQKLNHAFAYGGPDLLKATVEKYLGLPILYYVVIDYDSFPEFVDMVGGVEMDVQKRMRYVDRAGGLDINIQPGWQLLDGKTALKYVRFRKDALGDIGRIQRQQQFIKALVKKAYDPRVLIKFPELAAQAMKIFKTDMSPTLAVQLAGFVQNELGRERMFFSMLPGEPAMIDRLSYWLGDVKAANAFLNAPVEALVSGDVTEGSGRNAKQVHFSTAGDNISASEDAKDNGQLGTSAARSGDKKDEMSKDELMTLIKSMPESVAVLNGTGKAGVSAEISTRLQQLGVDVIHSGNAKHFDYQHCNIVYPTNASEKVKTTARQLGTLLKIPKNLVRPSQQAFYASIIAGHDYKKLTILLDNMLKISNQ